MYSSKTQTQTDIELEDIVIPYKEYRYLKGVELCYYGLVFVLSLIMIATIIIINIGE